ncbi:MAG TPA: hypothetical protein ENL39_01170 [Candidatus Aerophobetes bacterium]|uniref:DUF1468 domain-containing protein n=1 Tax=Aerophobetes bacterium TaxID=2030807 RepID=A0A7V5LZ17_UNCAE|nr:hypothetical protein [Candidatus Aerophobetes bacterium]
MKKIESVRNINTDRISSIIMLIIVGTFASQLIGRTFTQYGILFPKVILTILVALSIGLLIKSWVAPELREISKEENKIKIVVGIVIMIIWIWTISLLGFLTSSIIWFAVLGFYISERKNLSSFLFIISAVFCMTILFWFIFHKILLVPFPRGIFV